MTRPSTADMAARLIIEGADPSSSNLLAGMFLDRLQFPPNGGTPTVVDAEGRPALDVTGGPKSPATLLGELRAALPQLFSPTTAKPSTSTTAHRENITAKAAREAGEIKVRQASGYAPNPWASGSVNLTQQVLIAHRDPAKATRLKAEASQ